MDARVHKKSRVARVIAWILVGFAALLILTGLLYSKAFGPMQAHADKEQFLVTPGESVQQIANDLAAKGFVRSPWIFTLAYLREVDGRGIRPGGYEIQKSM